MHGAEHLYVAPRIQPEAARHAVDHHVTTVSRSELENLGLPREDAAPILPLFSADEWLRLRFRRWLHHSGRLPR